jgi:hypothetical protein
MRITSAAAFETNTSRCGSSAVIAMHSLKKCPEPVNALPKRGVGTSIFAMSRR